MPDENNDDIPENNEDIPENIPEDDPVDWEAEAASHQTRADALAALLAHLHEGIDVEAEMNNVAVRPDGTSVYVGGLGAEPEVKAKPRPKPRAVRRGGGARTPDLAAMSHAERSKHLSKMLAERGGLRA